MPRKANKDGRSSTSGRFVMLPCSVLDSPGYHGASLAARALLVEVAALYRGRNNGFLGLSCRQASERLGCSKDTAGRAFRELQARGLIEAASVGKFSVKVISLASEWRLSWKKCDLTNTLPTHAYRTTPAKEKGRSDPRDSTVR